MKQTKLSAIQTIIEDLSEAERYGLFLWLSEVKSSDFQGLIPLTFLDKLLKQNLSKLVGEDIDKYLIKR